MKKTLYLLIITALVSCSTLRFNFQESSDLTIDRSTSIVYNNKTGTKYPMKKRLLDPNYIGGHDLNFITGKNFNEKYGAYKLIKESLSQLPFKEMNIEFVYADKVVVMSIDKDYRKWSPNNTFDIGEEVYIEEKEEWEGTAALETYTCWRNLIISSSKRRILCVDRVLLNGRNAAIVYIMQAEKKKFPYQALYHWNITKPELLPSTGPILDGFANITRGIMKVNM